MGVDGLEVADPEDQPFVLGCTRPEQLLPLGELIESRSGVVGVEVLDED
jgi:hypothetical protein